MKILIQIFFLFCLTANGFAQQNKPIKVEPTNWWIGMKNSHLQLLVHHENIGSYQPKVKHKGVTIKSVHTADSPNYLFIDLLIDKTAQAGTFDIVFSKKNSKKIHYSYELKKRAKPATEYIGFNSSDAIYLITPDRFANGNPQNDIITDLKEKNIDRTTGYTRHGGDITGITQHLDYIDKMGFTAIWVTPLLINDMPKWSYHGYAMTDFYAVDPRFGTLEEYKNLSKKAAEKDIKLIMDQVANHCGLHHWWMSDLPFKNWVNYQENFEKHSNNWGTKHSIATNHARTTHQDIYASQSDKKQNTDGWFVPNMPDLNQRNPYLAQYIIQNSIWWIETLQLGGIRQDTYPYPDKEFMANWAGQIMAEYPNFNIVGEEWSYNPLLIAYWQKGAKNNDGYQSPLPSTMDFANQKNIIEALNEKESWDSGLTKIYAGLANDFHYASPKDLLIFLDNHDMDRVFTALNHNVENTKMAISLLSVLPRIAQFYYGTEIGLHNSDKKGDHGLIRSDFIGGWETDNANAFTQTGLTDSQRELQDFTKKVFNFRKNSSAIHNGKTIHFSPKNATYFIFRILDNEVVVHIINKNEEPVTIDLSRFDEIGLNGKTLRNVITGDSITWKNTLEINKKGSLILTTK